MSRTLSVLALLMIWGVSFAAVSEIPTDDTQNRLTIAYQFAWNVATTEQWTRNGNIDPKLGFEFGELPILWIVDDDFRGSFIYPDSITDESFTSSWETSFDIDDIEQAYSISVPGYSSIAIFKSCIEDDMGQLVTWQANYFRNALQYFITRNVSSWAIEVVDSSLDDFDWRTRLLIIPVFTVGGIDGAQYIKEVADSFPDLEDVFEEFLEDGGVIYAEGNGGYLLELLGLIDSGTVDISKHIYGSGRSQIAEVEVVDSTHPLSFVTASEGIYTIDGPALSDDFNTILKFKTALDPLDVGKPAVIEISGGDAHCGKIILSAGMPTAGIVQTEDNNQWLWTANAVLSAFSHKVLHQRKVHSPVTLPESTHVAPFAIPADDSVTITITVRTRNLWNEGVDDVKLSEYKSGYLYYVDCPTGPPPTVSGNNISWTLGRLSAGDVKTIEYRLRTPDITDPKVDDLRENLKGQYLRPSSGIVSYEESDCRTDFDHRYDLWTMVLFSANILADADLNWKNILGEYYQPFKIFMTMENKERTSALNTKYVQHIPLDVPIYWVGSREIPIIRTPGGKFVDVLRGTADSSAGIRPTIVTYDMDKDGDPDAWLNFSTIHPKYDSVELVEIYWFNPWSNEYEDIDHDGIRPVDSDGDGIFEVEDPDDKIRAWRLVWNIGQVIGYGWFDPYVSWELWIDPPPLLEMAKGAGKNLGLSTGDRAPADTGYYYENWQWWMEHQPEDVDKPVFVRLIYMTIRSYEGFRFVPDTSYRPPVWDTTQIDAGIIPYPRRAYIAVMNLGGHEPTMKSPFPPDEDTTYGKVTYKTIWGQYRYEPIRVSYTYYAPLPNPLQFEYVNQAYKIIDPGSGTQLPALPSNDEAYIDFKVTASTEYTYYWLANVGYDLGQFDYDYINTWDRGWDRTSTVPDSLGDGVFGYVVVTIPKGIGDYSIKLPRDAITGEFDWEHIFPEYVTLIDTNSLIDTAVYVLEYPFKYEIYCPQILIPPALDDDDFDGVDDWMDDKGDRFVSSTGYLHDIFPPGDGEDAEIDYWLNPWDTTVTIEGDLAHAHKGWNPGPDSSYGDDLPEKLGETHLTIRAIWEGSGWEGPVKVNDGAVLVNEEIFGGSPWVQWSHALFAEARGHHIAINRDVTPTIVSLYLDTIFLRYEIYDKNEPHKFNELYDPWANAFSNGQATIIAHIGGRDPSSLFEPDVINHSRIDPTRESVTVTAIPWAEDLPDDHFLVEAGYPKEITGAILTTIVEVDNASGLIWDDITCKPDLSELGSTEPVLWYSAYPRPFVPAHYDPSTEEWLPGDDPRTFRAGWRFNSSEREMLFMIGNEDGSASIPEVLSSRRVYFIFHLRIDPSLQVDVYDIPFKITANVREYDTKIGDGFPSTIEAPSSKFAIVRWGRNTTPPFVIAPAKLTEFEDSLEGFVSVPTPVSAVWDWHKPEVALFDTAYSSVSGSYSDSTLTLTLPSDIIEFPTKEHNSLWFGIKAVTDPIRGDDKLLVSNSPIIRYNDWASIEREGRGSKFWISAQGPQITPFKAITEVNGEEVRPDGYFALHQGENEMVVTVTIGNPGNDLASDPKVIVNIGKDAEFVSTSTPFTYNFDTIKKRLIIEPPDMPPGKRFDIPIKLSVPTTEIQRSLEICYTTVAEFYGPMIEPTGLARTTIVDDRRKFTETDPETLYYGANLYISDEDISLANQINDIGDDAILNVKVHYKGNMKLENVPVRITDQNGIQVGEDQYIAILAIQADSFATVSFTYPMNNWYERAYVYIDPDSIIGETNEKDNMASCELTVGRGNPLTGIINYPNPFKDYTEIIYTLLRPVQSLKVEVFTLRGRLVKKFAGPTTPGYHALPWTGQDNSNDQIANGSYIYKITAKDSEGKKFVQRSIAVRMR